MLITRSYIVDQSSATVLKILTFIIHGEMGLLSSISCLLPAIIYLFTALCPSYAVTFIVCMLQSPNNEKMFLKILHIQKQAQMS